MLRSLGISATGLDAEQKSLDVISNNIANAGTTGFKKSRPVFQDLMYQAERQVGSQSSDATRLPSGLQVGTGVRLTATERIHSQGTLTKTDNPTDIAISGQGFFQVLLPDGTTAYTRDGSFQRDRDGQLVTASGYPVQPAVTIPQNATSFTVAQNGIVSVTQGNSATSVQVGQLQLAMFMNPAGLQSRGDNLYIETDASGAPAQTNPGLNGAGDLTQGYTESSNVNVVEEMVNLIQAQRLYELDSKAMTTEDQMLQKISEM